MKGLKAHIIETTDNLANEAKIGEYNRVMLSVWLARRYRDKTLSDRFGYFSSRGFWRELEDMTELRTFNIVQPTVRATKSVITQANPKISIQPRLEKNYRQQLNAEFARALVEQDERDIWTSSLLEQIGDKIQIDPGAFLKTDWSAKTDKTAKITKYEKSEFLTSGEAICPMCDHSQIVEEMILPDTNGFGTIECRECGDQAIITTFPKVEDIDFPAGEFDVPVGKPQVTLHSALQFIVDENGTAGGELKRAKWLCHRYLVYEYELKKQYPEINLSDSSFWSFATQWLYALEKDHNYITGITNSVLKDFTLHEVQDWYFIDDVFEARREDADCKIGNISLKRGESVLKKLGNPTGVCFRRVGNDVAEVFAKDFRRTFQYISFLKDPHSFWALPQTILCTCQDLITEYVTIQADVASRNIQGTTIVNGEYLNEEDLLQPIVRTKKAYPTEQRFEPAMHIPPAPISNAPMQMVEMSMQMKDKLSGVSSIMMGELPGNEPYSSVALQREQSMGLLSTGLNSIAEAKKDSDKEILRLRRENMKWPEFQEFIENNESLTPEHISAFTEGKIDTDLAVDFISGTVIPRSLFERELALRQHMNDFMALANLNPQIVSATNVNDFLNALTELTNSIEIDVSNLKAEKQLAQNRFQKLKEFSEKVPENYDTEILAEILEHPYIAPLMIENHETHKEFYADRLRSLALQKSRNFALEELCKLMYAKHDQLEVEFGRYQLQKQMKMQEPAINQQTGMETAQKEQEAQRALLQKAEENRLDTEKLVQDEAIKSRSSQR